MTILLRMDDKMNRQLTCPISPQVDSSMLLAQELVHFGFVNEVSRVIVRDPPCAQPIFLFLLILIACCFFINEG